MTEKEGLLQRIEKLRSSNGVGMFEMTDEEENSFRWGHARAIVDVLTELNKTIADLEKGIELLSKECNDCYDGLKARKMESCCDKYTKVHCTIHARLETKKHDLKALNSENVPQPIFGTSKPVPKAISGTSEEAKQE